MSGNIDLLNREEFIKNMVRIINQLSYIKKGCCFAVEGNWGIGKTFVINEIEEKLEEVVNEEDEKQKYFVFHYNCWKYDYYEEPSIAIMSALLTSICDDKVAFNKELEDCVKSGYEFVFSELKGMAGTYLENRIGVNLISWVDEVEKRKVEKQENLYQFDQMFCFGQTIQEIRVNLEKIAEERTIVLFVDELDRCIPQYSIKVLERIHHIFYGLENVIVVMAIDRKQLEHSIEEMFGHREDKSNIDIERYLKKFIDFSVVLENGVINDRIREKYSFYFDKFEWNKNGEQEVEELLRQLFSGIDIRSQEKIFRKTNMLHSIVCQEKADISIMLFEIIYEVFRMLKVTFWENIVMINESDSERLVPHIGGIRINLLKAMEEKAWNGTVNVSNRSGSSEKKYIRNNMYGKIFWYFSNIFNEGNMPYIERNGVDEEKEKNLKIVKMYFEFAGIIK